MSRVRRIAEEEYILVVLLAGFGLIFLLIFPPSLIVNDTWLNLTIGREIVENGLPTHDELTVYGAGRDWTDQQWLTQIFLYASYSLGGAALLSIVAAAFVVTAFAFASAAARMLGAGPRAIWVMFLPVLLAAPWAWSIRAQMLALPFYTGLLWLLSVEARRPSRRIWLALPILVVWANVHGSVILGALLVTMLGAFELARSRGASWRRSVVLLLAPLAVLATPYGPVATARYYRLMILDPPFAGQVTEWEWAKPAVLTLFFYVLVAIALPLVVLGRRRLTAFDLAVLAITLGGALVAIRGVVWFALACMVFVPVAIGRRLESKSEKEPLRRVNVVLTTALAAALVVVALSSFLRPVTWYETYWPREAVEAVRGELEEEDRVFAPDRFSNWMLYEIPQLRGRLAYDIRFEVFDETFFARLLRYAREEGSDWKSLADGYRIVIVDETRRSHTDDFLEEDGARVIYQDDELTVIARPRR